MSNKKFRLHIENLRAQPFAFHITPERYERAAKKFPTAAADVDVTFGWDGEGFEEHVKDADCVIGWNFPKGLVKSSSSIKWIHVTGAGIEHLLPLDWLPIGSVLTNNSGVHSEKASEYALLAVLALNNRLPYFGTMKVKHEWSRRFSRVVTGKTVLIVGTGNMGQAAAKSCKLLRTRVVGISLRGMPAPGFDETYSIDRLDEMLPQADFVIVAVPLTDQTRGLLSGERLSILKREAGLINIGRAAVVDYKTLAERLKSGELAGAMLDVFPAEPMPADSYLWDVPNLLITPHVSSDDEDSYASGTVELFFSNFHRLQKGEALANQVDPARQY